MLDWMRILATGLAAAKPRFGGSPYLGVVSSIALFLPTTAASAATLNVVDGQLLGASQVDVGGTLYDVAFVDGTCITLFDGCDSLADFTFTNVADATAASQALLDQVFLDGVAGNFDTHPELTAGCSHESECKVLSPFGFNGGIKGVSVLGARNGKTKPTDPDPADSSEVFVGAVTAFSDTGIYLDSVFAVWNATPVPEPGTGILLGMGMLVVGARRYGQVRDARAVKHVRRKRRSGPVPPIARCSQSTVKPSRRGLDVASLSAANIRLANSWRPGEGIASGHRPR